MESHLLWPSIFSEFPRKSWKVQWITLLVFVLEQTTYRPSVLGAEIPWPLHRPRTFSWTFTEENLLYITPKMYVLFLFPNNLLTFVLKVFIFTKQELLTPFLIYWRKLTECYSKLLPTTSATSGIFSCTFDESISIDVSKKAYVILCNFCTCSKNSASSRGHYL